MDTNTYMLIAKNRLLLGVGMKNWMITLEGKLPIEADDVQFVFQDISNINSKALKPAFFEAIFKQIESNPNYTALENVKYVIDSEGKSLPHQGCTVIFYKEKETKQRAIAFYQLEDGNLLPIGVWPEEFAKSIKSDFSYVLLSIGKLLTTPNEFEDVSLVLPIKLGQEPGDVPEKVLWSALLEGEEPGPEDDWVLEFEDLKYGLERPKVIQNHLIMALLKIREKHKHYQVIKQIKEVKSNVNEFIPIDQCFIINIFTLDEGVFVNLLLHMKKDGNFELIGMWPPPVVETYRKNKSLIDMMIFQIVQAPETFKRVDVFYKIDLGEELASSEATRWMAKYEGEEPKEAVNFIDSRTVIPDVTVIGKYFNQLKAAVEQHDHYKSSEEIIGFQSPQGDQLQQADFSFFVATQKDEKKWGLLFKREDSDSYALQGIFDESFLSGYYTDDKVLFEFLESILKNPESFKDVKVNFPS